VNILFVHEVDWQNKVVFDIHSFSELLASFGHNVFIIDFTGFQRGKPNNFAATKNERLNLIGRSRQDISITVIRPALIKAPFLDRASAFITHYIAIENTIKANKIDAIVLYSVPTNGIQVIKLAKKYNIPVIFRSIDVLYKLVPTKILSAPTFSLETWVYKNSDKILTLSPKLSDYVIRMKAKPENVDLLFCGVDLSKFNPNIKSEQLRKVLGFSKNDQIILFMGTLYDFSGLDSYLKQFSMVLAKVPNARLLIVGGGPQFNQLKKLTIDLGLSEKVTFTGFRPFELMPQFIRLADVCIMPFKINATTQDIIPLKTLQYLACGKPVLSTPLPGMTVQLKSPQHGLIYAPIVEFASNTVLLLNDRNLAQHLSENAYKYIVEYHNEINLARKLEQVLYREIKKKKGVMSK
jgi:glycosyltransferase involved in cell wall biosynthesis